MKPRRLIFALSLLPLSFTPALAEEIGRATIDGREVVIDSNGTWSYADGAAAAGQQAPACAGNVLESKKVGVSFCLAAPWKLDSAPAGAMEIQAHHPESDIYFGLIPERTQMPAEALRRAIIYNAAQATNTQEKDIPVAAESKETFNGKEWNYIQYDVDFSGAKFTFANYYVTLGDRGVVQAVFWCSPAYFEQNKDAMKAMMTGFSLAQK
ncbi:MAG: hypothetical protein HC855_16525 [Rhizobiales bacterium]|nr:hypothetical protein [Hyphomicrobiales bacterium]